MQRERKKRVKIKSRVVKSPKSISSLNREDINKRKHFRISRVKKDLPHIRYNSGKILIQANPDKICESPT